MSVLGLLGGGTGTSVIVGGSGGIPAGINQLVGRDGAGALALFGIGSNLVSEDGVISAVVPIAGGTDGQPKEIDGSLVLTRGHQWLNWNVDGVLTTIGCYAHNSADETAEVILWVPWDWTVSSPGTLWEIARGAGFTGVLKIDRQPKVILEQGDTANDSTAVANIDTSRLVAGVGVSGTGIQVGTVVNSIDSATGITLSLPATATGSPVLSFAFGQQGTLNGDTAQITVANIPGACVVIRVAGGDDPESGPDVRVSEDITSTQNLLGDINANGKNIYGIIGPPLTISGVLTGEHSDRHLELNGNATIPGTAGWRGVLEAVGGSRTVTFNSLTKVLAAGDVMTILVKSASTYTMFVQLNANRGSFA